MRTRRTLSFSAQDVLESAGSRYGPAAPLVDFDKALDRQEAFALVGKPCDIGAVRNLTRSDPRIDRYMKYALSFVCGGESDLLKSRQVLAGLGVEEDEVPLFRYRGFGNPGPTRIETRSGRAHEMGFQEMWADEATWRVQPRCRICPDSIGEAADIVASDVWTDGSPTAEDEGFNGVLVPTAGGAELFEAAVRAGAVVVERPSGFREMDAFQPHQVRRRRTAWARLAGMAVAGSRVVRADNLRTRDRVRSGRFGEPLPGTG